MLTGSAATSRDHVLWMAHGRGLSQRDIAEVVGLSQRWVCYRMKALGLAPNGYATEASRRKRSESVRVSWSLRGLRDARWRDVVELAYPVEQGRGVRPDGYRLFAGLCRAGWPIHGDPGYQVLWRGEDVVVRCSAAHADRLPGGRLTVGVGRDRVALGAPARRPLAPSPSLESGLVTVKHATDPGLMRAAVRARLDALAAGPKATVTVDGRRVLRVNGVVIVGYAVRLDGLTGRVSLRVQAGGVGGRHRFGCGVFVPC